MNDKKQVDGIDGYRQLTEREIAIINEIKNLGGPLGAVVEALRASPEFDQRWVDIGAADLQTGLMALTRAVARPTNF